MPYYLASLWDMQYAVRAEAERKQARRKTVMSRGGIASDGTASPITVPKEIRRTLKRARGAKPLLQNLEEQIRSFITSHHEAATDLHEYSIVRSEDLESDEELIFVGRNGEEEHRRQQQQQGRQTGRRGLDGQSPKFVPGHRRSLSKKQLICEGLVEDQHASFG